MASGVSASTFQVTVFDGKTDFNIRKQKMQCVLVQQRVYKAIDHSYIKAITDAKKTELNDLVYSTIMFNLSDYVIRKVDTFESMSYGKNWIRFTL